MSLDQIALSLLINLNVIWGNPVTNDELMCISHTVYHEAATESVAGKVAVANVIKNRVEHKKFPNNYCKVVKQPYAFSYLLYANRKHLKINNTIDLTAFEDSVIISLTVMTNSVGDITNGSTHYLNKNKLTRLPNWYKVSNKNGKIGNHTFVSFE